MLDDSEYERSHYEVAAQQSEELIEQAGSSQERGQESPDLELE